MGEQQVAAALAEHERSGRPLGEVLVAMGVLSAAALAEALLLQRMWRPLGQLLVERGLIDDDQLAQALTEQDMTGRPLGEIVRVRFSVSAAALGDVLAEQHELELETERGFGTGLRRGIDARDRRRRGVPAETTESDDALLLTRLRPTGETTVEHERLRTLQAAVETREETIAALSSANRRACRDVERLGRELADRDARIDALESRIAELEAGGRTAEARSPH